jgi:hypothetical protein
VTIEDVMTSKESAIQQPFSIEVSSSQDHQREEEQQDHEARLSALREILGGNNEPGNG